jgi:hypothetical protein
MIMKINIRHLKLPDVITALKGRQALTAMTEDQKNSIFDELGKTTGSVIDVTGYATAYGGFPAALKVVHDLQAAKVNELKSVTSAPEITDAIAELEAAIEMFVLLQQARAAQLGLFGQSRSEPPSMSYASGGCFV